MNACRAVVLLVALLRAAEATTRHEDGVLPPVELPKLPEWTAAPLASQRPADVTAETMAATTTTTATLEAATRREQRSRRPTLMDIALQASAREGLDAMAEFYAKTVPDIVRNGQLLQDNHPAALLSKFSAPAEDTEHREMAAFATISATKAFRKNYKYIDELARQAHSHKISLRRTALEGLCPARDPPACAPASDRYRTHDGTCNNQRRQRWGASQMPFNRFLPPVYGDGVDAVRNSVEGGSLSSSRFVSLLVHGARDGEAALTLMTAQWGQLLDHDMTSTAQPRSINGSVPSCCGSKDFHPSCFPIKVPLDDPWLAPLKVRCLEFLRSAPAQRRDCVLSWREQTNQATSFIDASPIYSNSVKASDNARVLRSGLLVFGRGNTADDVCHRGAIATGCIRAGDGRSGEQPGLLALHHVWVGEHNRIASDLAEMNQHWSDEKIYQETRRIIGAMFQHITFREFLPIVLGREVCKLFDLDLLGSGYYEGYDAKVNPTVANSFAAAAFRFGHSLVQNSYQRCDRHHNVINNNVSLHEEFQRGDIGSAGSLHRLLRGMASQRALKRDEFITPELTNHLFQTPGFPFGLDLAAINIQRGRDHGIAPYTSWRIPCGLTPINNWEEFANVVGPESAQRIGHAYRSVHDIDLFVGGIAERPVVGGLVGPTFGCIIAQQFSNSRKGDRFWYENGQFESSFTPAQLHSIRRVSLAQVLCRAVGGGTFQPHIFIPAEFAGNERLPCGVGSLEPIDLSPWLEQDPFAPKPLQTFATHEPEKTFDILPTELHPDIFNSVHSVKENKAGFSNRVKPSKNTNNAHKQTHPPHLEFVPNASTGFQRPLNVSKINDKLDIRRKQQTSANRRTQNKQKPIIGVNNKLDKGTRVTASFKADNQRPHTQSTTKRTVVINNVQMEVRAALNEENTNTKTSSKTSTDVPPKKHKLATKSTNKTKHKTTTTTTPKADKPEPREDIDETNMKIKSDLLDVPITEAVAHDESADIELDSSTVAEEDIFDIFSTLTEPSIDRTTTGSNKTRKPEKREDDATNHPQKPSHAEHDRNSDIDPMTHSPSKNHKRIQRKPNFGPTIDRRTLETRLARNTENLTDNKPRQATNKSGFQPRFTSHLNPSHKIRSTTTTTKAPFARTKPTQRNVELRQYQTPTSYTRPHKVVLDGHNSDQYEIEINIRQTNKSPPSRPLPNYPDYTTANKPYAYDRYSSNFPDYTSTTPQSYGYYQPPPTVASLSQVQRTKPPTVIYLNEHDDRTTTRQPGLLQNFISFASNSFSGHHRPNPISTAQKEKPSPYESGISGGSIEGSVHSSHSAVSHYSPRPPYPQSQQPISSSFSQVGGHIPAGPVHATSSAISSGSFGSIVGVASANGADSTFSFNIRPRPETAIPAPHSESGSYGLLPSRKPAYSQGVSPQYVNLPIAVPQNEIFYGDGHQGAASNSPFSSHTHKQSQLQGYFSRTQNDPQEKEFFSSLSSQLNDRHELELDISDYDYASRTLDTIETADDKDNSDEDKYDDYDEHVAPGKKYDLDGYLRPEHMAVTLFAPIENAYLNETCRNCTLLDDNYVLPVINASDIIFKDMPLPITKARTDSPYIIDTKTEFPNVQGKHFKNDILAEDYLDDTTEPFIVTKADALTRITEAQPPKSTASSIAFAPINILTKPERPDNWVVFDMTEEKPMLPELPEMDSDVDSVKAAEVPKPIKGLSNVWLTKLKLQESGIPIRNAANDELWLNGRKTAFEDVSDNVTNLEPTTKTMTDVFTQLPRENVPLD